ncbi:MAG TPA: hypothetical protein DCY94_02985 [Firmicutes bacterium]|nr:hypothetical protein [Bacillota bacterium]
MIKEVILMLTDIEEGSLIVVKDPEKKEFLKRYRKEFGLSDIKVLGLNEFKKKYYFDYTKEAIFWVHKKYGCIKSIAEMYLENLYFIKDGIHSQKIDLLREIKDGLTERGLLKTDELFKASLQSKTIVLYDLEGIDDFYENMFKEISNLTKVVRLEKSYQEKGLTPLYSFVDAEREIEFVASKIAELIKKGISPSKIKIANVKDDYTFSLKTITKDFNIPLELQKNETIKSSKLIKSFKEGYKDNLSTAIENTRELVHTPRDEKIFNSLLDVANSYYWAENKGDIRDFMFEDIDSIKVPNEKYDEAVKTVDFLSSTFTKDDYIFLMNFNQGSFPDSKKDEDYLSDKEKLLLGISDSIDLNRKISALARKKILSTSNLVVTYSKKNKKGDLYISPVYDATIFEEMKYSREFTHSDAHNLKELIKEKDENRKYGTTTDTLLTLRNHYDGSPYMNYDNKFKGIAREKLMGHLQNKLTLSYSSMNTYYQCAFRYYLDNILKMDEFDSTFETTIGSIFHRVLSLAFKDNFDFDLDWRESIERETFEFRDREKFFLNILKDELKFIIEGIEKGMEYTELKEALYEQKITVQIDDVTTFKGFVDKILYTKDKSIAAIIDYKTGNTELKLDNAYYGLDMQLPIYAYLLKNYEPLKDAAIGGFYIENILANTRDPEQKLTNLKLQGYSNSSIDILSRVDKNYENSKIIKSLKMGANGFYSYAKILSEEKIDCLIHLVEAKIREAAANIEAGNFEINPKKIGLKEYGCQFCKYRDICYKTAADTKKLKEIKKEEFLGGEQHADVD